MGLELPNGMRIEAADPTAAALGPILGAINANLLTLTRQLDALIKLECGVLKRQDFARIIEARELEQARAAKAQREREEALLRPPPPPVADGPDLAQARAKAGENGGVHG